MNKSRVRHVAVRVLIIVAIISSAACGHKQVKSEESVPATDAAASAGDGSQSSDQGNAQGLQTIHFSYDSNTLTAEAKTILKADAQILKTHPAMRIQIEGHCDQRGGIQYNIALGERRAVSAQHFLQDLGIEAGRITTISYGKERPIDPAESDAAYAKNRRANFVITKSMG